VAVKCRMIQDRRKASRLAARLSCTCTWGGIGREAFILDLSLKGAQLSSRQMPPVGEAISITLLVPLSKDLINLEGKVTRGIWGQLDHGPVGKFSVRFHNTPLRLMSLVASLK
jgi:hypothetical protein